MPYIITITPRPTHDQLVARIDGVELPCIRTAVATLDEAREAALQAIDRVPDDYNVGAFDTQAIRLTESGGTVGPLPDGTVIEVRQISGPDLATLVGAGDTVPNLLAAFNAR